MAIVTRYMAPLMTIKAFLESITEITDLTTQTDQYSGTVRTNIIINPPGFNPDNRPYRGIMISCDEGRANMGTSPMMQYWVDLDFFQRVKDSTVDNFESCDLFQGYVGELIEDRDNISVLRDDGKTALIGYIIHWGVMALYIPERKINNPVPPGMEEYEIIRVSYNFTIQYKEDL